MKKLILTTVCAMAMAGVASAQYLNWSSISFSAMTAQSNSVVYSPLFGGGPANGVAGATGVSVNGFYYELLYGGGTFSGSQIFGANSPSNSFNNLFAGGANAWLDTGLEAVNSGASAGRLAVLGATSGASVPWSAGTTDNIVLVGWSSNLGTSWLTVSNELATGSYISVLAGANGFFGASAAGYLTSGSSSSSGTIPFANAPSAAGLPIFSLATPLYLLPVPEPATIALAGLGGLAMLAFRRQRK